MRLVQRTSTCLLTLSMTVPLLLMPMDSWALFGQKADKADEEIAEDSPIKVQVQGAEESLAENLKVHLPSLRRLDCESTKERVERFIKASQDKLTEGAEAMGYFSARTNMTAERQANCWVLNIAVQPRKPVRVRRNDMQLVGVGKADDGFQEAMKELPYKTGDVLVNAKYEDFKTKLRRIAQSHGYFDAKFTEHVIVVYPEELLADITLRYDTGKRYQFGEVVIEQDILDEKRLGRYTRIEKGSSYSSDALRKQQQLLEASGYYSEVLVQTEFDKATGDAMPVRIVAKRRKRYSYAGKLGFATDTGAHFEVKADAHWVNDRGHKLTAQARVSEKDPFAALEYKVPLWEPEHEYASLLAKWERSDNDDIKGEALELEFNYNRRNKDNWKQTAFVKYLDETTQVDNEPETHSQLTLLGARVQKTQRDDPIFPTRGWRLSAEVQGAAEGVLSDQSLVQGTLNAKYLHTLDNGSKLIGRGSVGSTWTEDFAEVPKSLRYFAGGQNSVRGYGFETLGETNESGEVIGGRHLLTGSLEYERPLVDKFSGAIFVDAGNAFDNWGDYAMHVGAGVGVRYKSPLGPIRVDLAVPEDDVSDVHFYFSLGSDL